ncbi:hypothetical protein HYFRA_00008325 [Hymenoscyphus fraxineus]|uniref:Uncharacterized protein n=1 Tax=Hymenoscyphus fraxineus TaxID=746836 RepID=A0A9N9PKM8_9HELO|nr:hypothetical protein HYFRA_00008325 [Hymenoscyphus fraxineus]
MNHCEKATRRARLEVYVSYPGEGATEAGSIANYIIIERMWIGGNEAARTYSANCGPSYCWKVEGHGVDNATRCAAPDHCSEREIVAGGCLEERPRRKVAVEKKFQRPSSLGDFGAKTCMGASFPKATTKFRRSIAHTSNSQK